MSGLREFAISQGEMIKRLYKKKQEIRRKYGKSYVYTYEELGGDIGLTPRSINRYMKKRELLEDDVEKFATSLDVSQTEITDYVKRRDLYLKENNLVLMSDDDLVEIESNEERELIEAFHYFLNIAEINLLYLLAEMLSENIPVSYPFYLYLYTCYPHSAIYHEI